MCDTPSQAASLLRPLTPPQRHKEIQIEIAKNEPSINGNIKEREAGRAPKREMSRGGEVGGEQVPNKMNGDEGSRTKLAAFVAAIIHGTNCTRKWKSLGNAATCKNALILVYESATPPPGPSFHQVGVPAAAAPAGGCCNITLLIF